MITTSEQGITKYKDKYLFYNEKNISVSNNNINIYTLY